MLKLDLQNNKAVSGQTTFFVIYPVCIWTFAGTSNQLFIIGFYTEIRFTKIIKQLVVKVRSL